MINMVVVMMIMMIIYRFDNGNNDDNIYDSDNDSYGDIPMIMIMIR